MAFKYPELTEEQKQERAKRKEIKQLKALADRVHNNERCKERMAEDVYKTWMQYSEGELSETQIVRLNELAWFAAETFHSHSENRKLELTPEIEDED